MLLVLLRLLFYGFELEFAKLSLHYVTNCDEESCLNSTWLFKNTYLAKSITPNFRVTLYFVRVTRLKHCL